MKKFVHKCERIGPQNLDHICNSPRSLPEVRHLRPQPRRRKTRVGLHSAWAPGRDERQTRKHRQTGPPSAANTHGGPCLPSERGMALFAARHSRLHTSLGFAHPCGPPDRYHGCLPSPRVCRCAPCAKCPHMTRCAVQGPRPTHSALRSATHSYI